MKTHRPTRDAMRLIRDMMTRDPFIQAAEPPLVPVQTQQPILRRIMQRVFLSITLVITCVLPFGCASNGTSAYATQSDTRRDPIEAQRLTQQAAKIIASDSEKAEQLLRNALAADIFHGPAHNNLGIIHLANNNLYEAANEFEWARKLMPGHPDPRLNLAITLEKAGQTEEALATYQTTLEVYPNYIPAIEAITRMKLRQGARLEENGRSSDSGKQLEENLKQIALRGSSEEWREWAASQLARADK